MCRLPHLLCMHSPHVGWAIHCAAWPQRDRGGSSTFYLFSHSSCQAASFLMFTPPSVQHCRACLLGVRASQVSDGICTLYNPQLWRLLDSATMPLESTEAANTLFLTNTRLPPPPYIVHCLPHVPCHPSQILDSGIVYLVAGG